jgi:receptor protein-tyrosine kinase
VLASSYVREVIRSLLERVDYVIVDTAPLLPVADGSEVAALADGSLLVARHKLTTEPQVKRAIAALERVDAKLLGVVLNRVPARRTGEYGYTYYRGEPTSSPHTREGGRRLGFGRGRAANGRPRQEVPGDDVERVGSAERVREQSGGQR